MADVTVLIANCQPGMTERLDQLAGMIDKYIPGHHILITAKVCKALGGVRITRLEMSAGEGRSPVSLSFVRENWRDLGVLMACERWLEYACMESWIVGAYYTDPRSWAEYAFLQQVGKVDMAEELARKLRGKASAARNALPGVFPGTNEPERLDDADSEGTDRGAGRPGDSTDDAPRVRHSADDGDAVPPAGVAGATDDRSGEAGFQRVASVLRGPDPM